MLVAAKKPRISVRVTGVGTREVVKALRKLYEVEVVDITTTEWWARSEATAHSGDALWTYRDNAKLTLARLSRMCGIAKSHLSAMENGKRPIGPRSARKLAKALGVDYRMFL